VLKPRDVEKLLLSLGFTLLRQRGSHRQYRHPDGRQTTLPFHSGRDLSPILFLQVARDIGITPEDLLNAGK
jgi:predicted RNA binding protein YcfA (HicA-like mRNA interferase family)